MEQFNIKRLICYSDVFHEQAKKINMNHLAKSIPTYSAISLVAYTLINRQTLPINKPEFCLFIPLMFKLGGPIQHLLLDYLNKYDIRSIVFFDEYALVSTIDLLLSNNNYDNSKLTRENYISLFKLMLCLNEKEAFNSLNLKTMRSLDDKLYYYLPYQMKRNNVTFPTDYRVEFIKFYLFMQFCSKETIYRERLQRLMDFYGIDRWDKYLLFIIDPYMKLVVGRKEGPTCILSFDCYTSVPLLSNLILNLQQYESSSDFIKLREHPVLQINDYELVVLNSQFLSDKIFPSFVFDFARINSMTYSELKKEIGLNFTEHYLFYSLMKGCFENQMDEQIDGRTLKHILKDGEPDYYMRSGNNIFLFECKDVVIDSKTKCSENYDLIINALRELFVETTRDKQTGKLLRKPKRKGVLQLLKVISEKLETILTQIDPFSAKEINVYPIIVYQDVSFDVEGVNCFLANIMKEQSTVFDINTKFKLMDLAMLPMYALIKLEDFFNDKSLLLIDILQDFIMYRNQGDLNSMIPFSKFLGRKAQNAGYKNLMSLRFRKYFDNLKALD